MIFCFLKRLTCSKRKQNNDDNEQKQKGGAIRYMKKMNRAMHLALAGCMGVAMLGTVACGGKERVLILTSSESYTIDLLTEKINEKFPEYKTVVEYMGTSNIAAKVCAEKSACEYDIVFAQEYGYISKMKEAGAIVDLSAMYDYSVYTDESLDFTEKDYMLPAIKTGGTVVINNYVLTQHGLQKPTSYQDLLDPAYDGLVSMPSPKSSGTGYMFYLSLVNTWGETQALDYFDNLTDNILAYTSSGSGPINALVQREVAVGFGMISQAVEKITSGNTELEIVSFSEGSPYNLYGNCIIKGKEQRESVKKVMDYLYAEFTDMCCEMYYPESVLKNKNYQTPNYPQNITYANMNNNTLENKEYLLEKWNH